ncbi:MAG: hypothetical protein ACR2M1_12380 [Gemmatimonadaceae bacterium]
MTTTGRKPGSPDLGYGEMLPSHARGSIAGAVSQAGWLTNIGGRLGRNTGTNSTCQYAVADASGSATYEIMGVTPTFTVSAVMVDSWSGIDYNVKPMLPILVGPGAPYNDHGSIALIVRASGASIAHGQDASGAVMYERTNITSFPATGAAYGPDYNRPEGKMSLWAEVTTNRRPDTPSNLSPGNGAIVANTTPTLGCDFRDADEVLPGFALGQGDKIKQYLFEVWNSAKTTRLQTSTIVQATAAQQTARHVTWASPALASGRYVARATVWDQFGTPSSVAEWTFTVSSGGTTTPSFAAGVVIGSNGKGNITNQNQPGLSVRWDSQGGVALDLLNVKVLDQAGVLIEVRGGTATPVRGPTYVDLPDIASGATGGWTFANPGWAPLPAGIQYIFYTQGMDANGSVSPWSTTPAVTINAMPDTPTAATPASGTSFSSFPVLSVAATDATDDTSTLTMNFAVRHSGDTGIGVVLQGRYNALTGRHELATSATQFTAIGAYEWIAYAADPWGQTGTGTPWTVINYVTPPAIVITYPVTDGDIIPTGTPTLTWTCDRTQATVRRVLTEVDANGAITGDGRVKDDTYNYGSSSIPVDPGTIHNGRRYRFDLTITTSDGLVTTQSRTFVVQYPLLPAMPDITVSTTPGPFEPDSDITQWSRIAVSWAQVNIATSPDAEFRGYVLRRTDVDAGETIVIAHLLTRDSVIFVDKTGASGITYSYSVSYLVLRNAFDFIESVPVSRSGYVALKNTVLASMDDESLGAVLAYWSDRKANWITDIVTVATWGGKPISFQGAADSTNVIGTFKIFDDPLGTFSVNELIAAVRAMARPRYDMDGLPNPRVLCFRDPKGRCLFVVLTSGGETDGYDPIAGTVSLSFVEIGVVQGVTLD